MSQDKPQSEQLACDICLKEIPDSVDSTFEGDDYISHFCGLECYDQWQQQKAQKEESA
ncbi:MAG: DUF3330 domain-containing protein [Gammaproteobacteria bacterium]|nr:DUF3330 domain-containing protein [Gammaproteobacteria bacterium]MDH5728043.1 DUF3330 domain-containing protein [Gammaproteobacteria bacterium]